VHWEIKYNKNNIGIYYSYNKMCSKKCEKKCEKTCTKFELYYVTSLPDGTNTGNSFNYTVTNNADSRVTIRQVKNKSFNNIPHSQILFDSKSIPANNAAISGISDTYAYQTFTINLGRDSIQCSAVFKNSGTLGVLSTTPTIIYGVTFGTGRFREVKKVVIETDNEGKRVNTWNPKGIKYARRITFYK
jgi:hypothetical protein